MCRHTDSAGNSASIVPADREVLPTNVKPLHYDVTMEPILKLSSSMVKKPLNSKLTKEPISLL